MLTTRSYLSHVPDENMAGPVADRKHGGLGRVGRDAVQHVDSVPFPGIVIYPLNLAET